MEAIEKRLGYRFNNPDLLKIAMTHKSFYEGSNKEAEDNEKLEFLGDSIINFIITEYIYNCYSDLKEGDLTKLRAHLVSSTYLFRIAQKLELGKYIKLGKGEEKNDGRKNRRILSSTFEALIGAVYIDSDYKITSSVVLPFFKDFLDTQFQKRIRINDYKSELQEILQKHRNLRPEYRLIEETGRSPDIRFTVAVYFENVEIGRGKAKNKREAEQAAAQKALKNIGDFFKYKKLSEVFFLKNDSIDKN